jgi:uncharacterized protein involved in cysteine biosynthesis
VFQGAWCAVSGLWTGVTSPHVRKTYWSALFTLVIAGWALSFALLWAVFHFVPVEAATSSWSTVGFWLLRVLLGLGALFVAAVLALPVAQVISPKFCAAPFFAGLELRCPVRATQLRQASGLNWFNSLSVLLRRLPRFVGISMLAFAVSFVPVAGGPLAATLQWSNAAWMVCSELLDPYFEARGLDYVGQAELMGRHRFACLGFGLVCAPLLALPLLGPFFFAWIQAAAAHLVVDVLEAE